MSGQSFPPVLKIENWSHERLATLTFYTAYAVRVTIFSTGRKFRPVSIFYVVTHSYSSHHSYALLIMYVSRYTYCVHTWRLISRQQQKTSSIYEEEEEGVRNHWNMTGLTHTFCWQDMIVNNLHMLYIPALSTCHVGGRRRLTEGTRRLDKRLHSHCS